MRHILIVDDTEADRELHKLLVRELSPNDLENRWEIYTASSLNEAARLLIRTAFDLVLLDIYVGSEDGIVFLGEIRTGNVIPNIKVILMSGMPRDIDIIAGSKLQIEGYVQKSFTVDEMRLALDAMIPKEFGRAPKKEGDALGL